MSDARVVQVSRHQRFGNDVFRPVNDTALLAAELAGRTEITDGAIAILKRHGYTVEIVAQASETL